jgi:hypothetical protein|tara:strand:+ start:4065 stop:4553 length:489 start_codon:yes stop_codon:yes gene_type:complete
MSSIQNNLNHYFEGGFKAENYQQSDNAPLPVGDYYVEIENAEVRQTNNKKGVGCNVTFSILGSCKDGSHSGRKIWNWFNLQHENEIAQKIGNAEFAGLCKALGLSVIENSEELMGGSCIAKIILDRKDSERNAIKAFVPADKAASPAPTSDEKTATEENPWG